VPDSKKQRTVLKNKEKEKTSLMNRSLKAAIFVILARIEGT
jgi:hypothetical protein